jgi:hypothetical protein
MSPVIRWATALAIAFAIAIPAKASGWRTTSITQIEIDSTGIINVYFTSNSECGSTRLVYVNSVIGNDDAKAMYAALLSWQAQGRGVNVYVISCFAGSNYGQFSAAYNQ